jgi:hypothetical protein
MDPIEKLLSDLAPPSAPGELDQAMARLFDRAEQRARRRRASTSVLKMATVLVLGLFAGYHYGKAATPTPTAEETSVTYFIPVHGDSHSSEFDAMAATRASDASHESMAVVVLSQGGD